MFSRPLKALTKSASYVAAGLGAKEPATAYVSGFLGKHNLGDEALYDAAKVIFQRMRMVHYDGSRAMHLLMAKMPYVKSGVFAGGTLINRTMAWYDAAVRFREISDKLYIFGTGVAHPSFWHGKPGYVDLMDKWKPVLAECSYLGVRGPLSVEVLHAAGLPQAEVIGDPVLILAYDQVRTDHVPNSIGFNIGIADGDLWGSDEPAFYREFVKLARFAKEAKWTVKWFVVRPSDLEMTRRAMNESGAVGDVIEIYEDALAYMAAVASLSTFAGVKLHATALATCALVPSVMLEYQPKCRDYMKSIGQEAVTVRTDRFKGADVWELAQAINAERTLRAQTMFAQIQQLKQKQIRKAEQITAEMLKL